MYTFIIFIHDFLYCISNMEWQGTRGTKWGAMGKHASSVETGRWWKLRHVLCPDVKEGLYAH